MDELWKSRFSECEESKRRGPLTTSAERSFHSGFKTVESGGISKDGASLLNSPKLARLPVPQVLRGC